VCKRVHSDMLNKSYNVFITHKAERCIKKAGGLDNYLLKTSVDKLGTDFGRPLRSVLKAKMKDPDMKVPDLKGTVSVRRRKAHRDTHQTCGLLPCL
jgi:hypothetical protein